MTAKLSRIQKNVLLALVSAGGLLAIAATVKATTVSCTNIGPPADPHTCGNCVISTFTDLAQCKNSHGTVLGTGQGGTFQSGNKTVCAKWLGTDGSVNGVKNGITVQSTSGSCLAIDQLNDGNSVCAPDTGGCNSATGFVIGGLFQNDPS